MDPTMLGLLNFFKENGELMKKSLIDKDFDSISEIIYNIYKIRLVTDPDAFLTKEIEGKTVRIDKLKILLLYTRYKLPNIGKVHIDKSTIHGKGVFASMDIKKGELLTFYPADVVLFKMQSEETKKPLFYTQFSQEIIKEYDRNEDRLKKFAENTTYRLDMDERYSIIGYPKFDQDSNFLGHYINDWFDGDPFKMNEQEYLKNSLQRINCGSRPTKGGLHIAVVAIKDISRGEELLTAYGTKYWETFRREATKSS